MEATKDITAITANMACITSLQIAEATAKNHKHIMRDIRNLLEQGCTQSNFGLCYRISKLANGVEKQIPYYNLTKKGALILASGYSALLRESIINRLEELETERKMQNQLGADEKPMSYPDILRNIAEKMERLQLENNELKQSLQGTHADYFQHRIIELAGLLVEEQELGRQRDYQLKQMNETLDEMKESMSMNALPAPEYEKKAMRETWKRRGEERIHTSRSMGKRFGFCSAHEFNLKLEEIGLQYNVGSGEWRVNPPFDTLGIFRSARNTNGCPDLRRIAWTDKGVQFFKVLFSSDMDVLKAVEAVGGDTSLFQSFAKKHEEQEEDAAQQVINF